MDLHVIANAFATIFKDHDTWFLLFPVLLVSAACASIPESQFNRITQVTGVLLFSILAGSLILAETGLFKKLNSPHTVMLNLGIAAVFLGVLVVSSLGLMIGQRAYDNWRRDRRIRSSINAAGH